MSPCLIVSCESSRVLVFIAVLFRSALEGIRRLIELVRLALRCIVVQLSVNLRTENVSG